MTKRPAHLFPALIVLAEAAPYIDIADGFARGGGWYDKLAIFFGVLVGIGVVAALLAALRHLQQRIAANQSNSVRVALTEATSRRVDDALAKGEFEAAGDLLVRGQDFERAAGIYLEGGVYEKAARAFREVGHKALAAHYYKRVGDHQSAAKVYAGDGRLRAAAAECRAGELFEEAAAYYEEAGDHRRAAADFARAGAHLRAAHNLKAIGRPVEAAQHYMRHFEARLSEAGGEVAELEGDADYARQAAQILRDEGDARAAADSFERGGFLVEAAECFESTGMPGRAAELLTRAGHPLRAASILEGSGQVDKAARIRAEAALEAGDELEAAKLFELGGERERAAELFERGQRFERAAQLYESLEAFDRASELYQRSESYGRAARCAEAAEDFARAAKMYGLAGDVDAQVRLLRRAGDFYQAGLLLFDHRRFDESLRDLKKIDSADPAYADGLLLQGDIFRSQGRHQQAYSRFRSALAGRDLGSDTLPIFYRMARSLEALKDLTAALDHYNAIVDVDEKFEDAVGRRESLRAELSGAAGDAETNTERFFSRSPDEGLPCRYELVDEIARGGMGIVYRARDTVLGRVVAFKILSESLRDNRTAVKYFLREARAAAALSHPNIVTIYDAGEQDGEYYMAMELIDGTTLKQLVKRSGPLSEDKVRYVLINCCRALEYAHSKGVLHRDIKSGNVMLARDKSLKVMDFGLAKFLKEYQTNHTRQVGTPFYMSPEQVIGKSIDFRSDLYSLGCTIFECATGRVPFIKGDLTYHHVNTPPPPPRSINAKISPEFEHVILKLLKKEPGDRFQSAREVIDFFARGGQARV